MSYVSPLPGQTSGATILSPYIGAKINGTIVSGTNVNNTIGVAAQITLTPGVYLIFKKINTNSSGQDGSTNFNVNCELNTSANTLSGNETYENMDYSNFSVGQQGPRWGVSPNYFVISANTTLYLNVRVNVGGSITVVTTGVETNLYAIRIA